jgi:hypothetical protein
MNEMMEQCCDSNGKPDFDMMKQFMKRCGKEEFSEAQIGMMNGFCGQEGMPDMTKMKELMEKCGCSPA